MRSIQIPSECTQYMYMIYSYMYWYIDISSYIYIYYYSIYIYIYVYLYSYLNAVTEGSSEVKLPTIWTDGKAQVGRVREEKRRRKKIKKEKVSEERRSRCGKLCFFQWFVAPEGRKVGSLKRQVQSHVIRWKMKSCTPLWREAHF